MESIQVKIMRRKQILTTNCLVLTTFILFYIFISVIQVTQTQFYFILGILLLFQAIITCIRRNSTKSIFSIYEQVAKYEKQKMGIEWVRQRKVVYITNFLLSILMFLQAYWSRNATINIIELDIGLMSIIAILMLILINASLIMHNKKVDCATSPLELKGYTRKTNLIAAIMGVLITALLFVVTAFYIIWKV